MRPQRSCANCNRRKQKCDLLDPCSRCIKLKVDCIYNSKQNNTSKKNEDINKSDIVRLDKKWTKIEEMVEVYKTIMTVSPPTSSSPTICNTEFEHLNLNNKREHSKLNLGYTQLIQDDSIKSNLMNIYFIYHHPSTPFLNEKRVRLLLNSQDYGDRALVASICAIALKIYNYLNGLPLLDIDDNPYYLKARKLTTEFTSPNLSILQAMLIQELIEMGHSRPFRAACLSAEATKVGQVLGLHNLNQDAEPSKLDETEMEQIKSWLQCLSLDQLTSIFFSKPSHSRLQDLTPIDQDLVQRMADVGDKRRKSKAETEYVYVHFFHHMVKLKAYSLWVNSQLQNGDYDVEKVYNVFKNLINGAKLELFEDLFDKNSKLYNTTDDYDLISDYDFISGYAKASFILAFSLFSHFLISKIFEFGDDEKIMISLEHRTKARETGKKLYKLICLAEERFSKNLPSDKCKLAYATHFCHGIGLEIAMLCHQDDISPASQRFIKLCSEKQMEFATFWPLYQNPLVKSQLIRVHFPHEIPSSNSK